MFGQTMVQTVEKEAVQKRIEKETELNQKIAKLHEELEMVMKQATKLGQKYQMLQKTGRAKEGRHNNEMEQVLKLLGDTKDGLKEERVKVRDQEARAQKETDSLILQVRELKVKVSTSRMREEDSLRTIADMQRAMEYKKATNKNLLDKLTSQNDKFKDELETLGNQMSKLKKPQNINGNKSSRNNKGGLKAQRSTTIRSSKESTLRMSETFRSQSTKSIRAQRILIQKELQKELVKEQTKNLLRKSSLKRAEQQRYNSDIVDTFEDKRQQYNNSKADMNRVKI